MSRIPVPDWAKPFHRSIEATFGQQEFEKISLQYESILRIVHDAVQAYVDERARPSETSSAGFPSRERLTGEYYIGEESYWLSDEPWFAAAGRHAEYRFSIMARCLEHATATDLLDRDYLGLDVHFFWFPADERFAFTGDVDSSSI